MTWQLRPAAIADLDAIMALETSIFTTDAWSRDGMRGELHNPHGYYLVASHPDSGHRVEGYAGLLSLPGAPDGDIQTIAVAESARGRGLGRLLMTALIDRAESTGASELFLEVRQDNPIAQTLYRSLGFEEIAVRVAYYQPDGVDAIIMRRETPEASPAEASPAKASPAAASPAEASPTAPASATPTPTGLAPTRGVE